MVDDASRFARNVSLRFVMPFAKVRRRGYENDVDWAMMFNPSAAQAEREKAKNGSEPFMKNLNDRASSWIMAVGPHSLKLLSLALLLFTTSCLREEDISKYYPHQIIDSCPQVPISDSEKKADVIGKCELNDAQRGQVIAWYKKHSFSIATDSSEIMGFGPCGLSFRLFKTNQVQLLVISQWKDM